METKRVRLTVDGRGVEVPEGSSILDACSSAGLRIPTLCYLKDFAPSASCGVCVVEVPGAKSLLRSCAQAVWEGMEVLTGTERVAAARRTALELILANHPDDCLACGRNGTCELQALAERFGIARRRFPPTRALKGEVDRGPALVRNNDKCVLCGRCVSVCREVQGVCAIDFVGRGARTRVAPFMERSMDRSVCVSCGQCTLVCPTGALTEHDQTEEVLSLLRDPRRTVVVQTAPAIRASLGEALGLPQGSLVTGKMVAALRRLGFNQVFDTQFTADLTIMEEGSELLERLGQGGTLPMITSCSPGWINFIETFYPTLLPHLSTCKSPQQMFGAVAKTFWARRAGVDPAGLVVVSIMPCTAKKAEARRPEMSAASSWWAAEAGVPGGGVGSAAYPDVDYALTTRELARMVVRAGLDFSSLPEEPFDDPLGNSTGAATIFGSTGGVMEAALRTAYELVVGSPLPSLELSALRGLGGVKTAQVDLAGKQLRVAVAHGLANARSLLEEIAAGVSPYQFVEIMSCPGGCVGGGGQPLLTDRSARSVRQEAIYAEDRSLPLRRSHENPAVKALYAEFLGQPLGHLSHQLLHTVYHRRAV